MIRFQILVFFFKIKITQVIKLAFGWLITKSPKSCVKTYKYTLPRFDLSELFLAFCTDVMLSLDYRTNEDHLQRATAR